ncbi:methyl-accepting chemotaxis protein [Roseburia sp. CLA-AA-H204]|uniref:Methyl-accepting chemotaxis protein n=1 Tax=Roseburia amylophila TaxID=2981794 RepID=A0AAW4WFC1_9FIRM|nr:methyl-accepting chemotaxis protein [Roseburia amylophila]
MEAARAGEQGKGFAVVGEVSEMSSQQEKIAGELKEVVGKFVL